MIFGGFMSEEFSRAELLLGAEAMRKLKNSRVAVFGVGGVGGYAVEALARCGVGALDLIDNDRVSVTNINRQILALHSTVGQNKTDVMADRIRDIAASITDLSKYMGADSVFFQEFSSSGSCLDVES